MTPCRVCAARTDAYLCRSCLTELQRAIEDMPSLMHEISILAVGQAKVYRANARATPQPAEPNWDDEQARLPAMLRSREGRTTLVATKLLIRLDARELLYDAWNTLAGWARHLAESRGAALPVESQLVGWLLAHLDAIRYDEAAAEIHDEITYIRSTLRRAVDRTPSRIYAGPCHAALADGTRCQRALYAWPGAAEILCDGYGSPSSYEFGCRHSHTADERQAWQEAEFDGALLPLDVWRAALPRMFPELAWPTRSTWWRWVGSGRIVAKSIDRDATELFRGGDVLDLVRAEQNRIIGNAGKSGRMSA